MPEHGHVVCPHCEAQLEGAEATCPACSGPLFGIATKQPENTPDEAASSTTTIDNVAVPTYTPPATQDLPAPPEEVISEGVDVVQELPAEDLVQRGEMLGIEGDHAEALR